MKFQVLLDKSVELECWKWKCWDGKKINLQLETDVMESDESEAEMEMEMEFT